MGALETLKKPLIFLLNFILIVALIAAPLSYKDGGAQLLLLKAVFYLMILIVTMQALR
jgi:hypothetical protein